MASLSLTQRWLADAVTPYPHSQLVYADVDAVLARHPTLRPKSDVYTFDDGRTQLLLCVHGLLPIAFRGAAYNIPIALWITREHPRQPPIVYVVPTADMLVRPGRHVDVSGRCVGEYAEQWTRKHEGCSLSALVAALQDQFAHEPPVYAKPPAPAPRPSPAARASPASSAPPALPSKPASLSPPPRPPQPPLLAPAPIVSPPPPLPPQSHFAQPPLPHAPAPSYAPPPPPPPPAPYFRRPDPPRAPIPDLLDEDAPAAPPGPVQAPASIPPRPPNPELLRLQSGVHQKLTAEFYALSQALAMDAEKLRAQQADLLAGEPAIKDEMARLEAVRDVCRSVADRTRAAVRQAEANIADLRRKGDPEVDELVCATSIVHNQLINLIADDNAIEDTVYHLHRALNAGRIDLEKFLRATRALAEEQFMKRALIEKIQDGVSQTPITPNWAAGY